MNEDELPTIQQSRPLSESSRLNYNTAKCRLGTSLLLGQSLVDYLGALYTRTLAGAELNNTPLNQWIQQITVFKTA